MSNWLENDSRMPQGRLAIVSYAIVGMIVLLLLGFWKLQVIDSERFTQLAERNRIRAIPIMAPRGRMLDREGRVLVDNYASFSILLLRDDPQQVERNVALIAEGLNVPLEDLEEQLEAARELPKFQPIVIKPEATQADIAFIESHRADFPALEMLMVHRRRYPPDGFLAHASGYVGEVSASEVQKSNGRYRPGDLIGKTGLERQYNETLTGTDGLRRVIVNSVGREVGRLEQKEAVPGKQIQLTIDYDLQVVAEQALAGRKGAVVALDPRNGEVLALASRPAPDPNLFAVRVPREEWKRLNEDPDRPLLNRVIQAQLAPGSVFKIIMATAMLESKAIPEKFSVFCTGTTEFYGRTFHCWQKHGHGEVTLHKAVVQSCDVFFYNVGKRLGIDRIAYYAAQMGLGRKTGVDLPGEESGLMPSEPWKQRVFHQRWYPGETISVAIGQGAVVATPVQLARTIGGIALGGVFAEPHLLMTSKPTQDLRFPLSEDTTEKVTQAMFGVVNEGGTAAGVHLEGIELCGKTGSAQVISAEGLKRTGKQKRFSDNAWFVGYAPRRQPEIVVAVLVEGGEHGASAAAPVARDVIKAYYDKKAKRNQQQYTVEYKRYDLGSEPLVAARQPVLPAGGTAAAEAEPRTKATKPAEPAAQPAEPVRQELRAARSNP
ncbi:MAG TPA: penicillin-binding protein 2 [Candidatus Acidoferrales bacterium]|nr:penicillin-binding protein 2 [Candidatus Acidoferrales bacterium]